MRTRPRGLILVLAVLACAGCVRGCPSSRPPIHVNPNMDDQPKVEPQDASRFFYDGSGMRPPVPHTVARGDLDEDPRGTTGKDEAGAHLVVSPVPVNEATLARGEERYRIYCAPCHTESGNGEGILFERGKVPTTSLLGDKVRAMPDGQIFEVISKGFGLMPAYGCPVTPADRWAIVAHVRRLQQEAPAPAAPVAGSPGGANP